MNSEVKTCNYRYLEPIACIIISTNAINRASTIGDFSFSQNVCQLIYYDDLTLLLFEKERQSSNTNQTKAEIKSWLCMCFFVLRGLKVNNVKVIYLSDIGVLMANMYP